MSVKHRSDSIIAIRKREAQNRKIADGAVLENGSIHLTLPNDAVTDGTIVEFCAPCHCEAVTGGVVIDGIVYTVVGADNRCVTGIGGVWESGAWLSVLIDCTNGPRAYLLNNSNYRLLIRDKKPQNGPLLWFHPTVELSETELIGTMIDVDGDGNDRALFPRTKVEAVDGLSEILPRMETGTYTGTGGTNVTINFDFTPKFVLVQNGKNTMLAIAPRTTAVAGDIFSSEVTSATLSVAWGAKSITVTSSSNVAAMINGINKSGAAVHYFALGI